MSTPLSSSVRAPVGLAAPTGLEGVVVADTELSRVDGDRGELLLRGRPVEEVAGQLSFAETCGLLWRGDPAVGAGIERELAVAREEVWLLRARFAPLLDDADGMNALRAGLAALPSARFAEPAAVTAAVGVVLAAWLRARAGSALPRPDAQATHAHDVLRMAIGEERPEVAAAFETYLTTVIDHGMNASTFTARVIASTGSDLLSAVVGALAALKGPLHGGAPGPVLDMLDAIAARGDAEAWLRDELAAGRRIMGMGHRVYRVRDPRAAVLEAATRRLADAGIACFRLRLAREVETTAERLLRERHPGRSLRANVELYTALVLAAIGLPRQAFTPAFAAGRVAGWCAHYAEQRATGRLIRPKARYIGPLPS